MVLSFFRKIFSRRADSAGTQPYSIEASYQLAAPLLIVTGEIDHHTSRALRTAIEREVLGPDQVVLFDLNAVTFMDSGGLTVLLDLVRALERGWVGIIRPRPGIRRLLEISGLGAVRSVRIFGDLEEARRALPAGGAVWGPHSLDAGHGDTGG